MRYFSILISLMVSLSVMAAPKSNHKEFAAKGNTTIKSSPNLCVNSFRS